MELETKAKGTDARQQGKVAALRRATVGPILAQELPPAGERLSIGISVAEHFALDNARFIAAVSFHETCCAIQRGKKGKGGLSAQKTTVHSLMRISFEAHLTRP